MKNAVIVTLRNSSKRLPNKSIMKVKGEFSAADIVLNRAKKVGLPVILATSDDQTDDIFESIAEKNNVKLFRGSRLNKIKRWYDCINFYKIDNFLQVDGDDLSYDYDIGKRAMEMISAENVDIICNPKNIVCGFFTYVMSRKAITELYKICPTENIDTDVISEYIKLAKLKIKEIELNEFEKDKNVRLTLDYQEDLEFFQKLYQKIDILESGKKIIEFLNSNKDIAMINYFKQKDYIENQEKFNE
jgi:spore coat polysaccharide biosynthesis protein SpsF